MLANSLARRDDAIPAGTFIVMGRVTAAIGVGRGDNVAVRFQDLGSACKRFVGTFIEPFIPLVSCIHYPARKRLV